MRACCWIAPLGLAFLLPAPSRAQIGGGDKPVVIRPPRNSKKEELPSQRLDAPARPRLAVAADATRLSSVTAPFIRTGLLSHQTRDALHALLNQARGATIVHLRAYVAGTGDLRRVGQIVSEVFEQHHQEPPALTVVQVGALPVEQAQLLLQALMVLPREANPEGVRWVASSAASLDEALAPLRQQGEALRTTCYVPALDGPPPPAGVDLIQPQRFHRQAGVRCEAIVRGAGVKTTVVVSGAQMAFSTSAEDARLAAGRLRQRLEALHADAAHPVYTAVYATTEQGASAARAVLPATGTRVEQLIESLPSIDGVWAAEAVAVAAGVKEK
jgi:hypothetical protein